jgi:hypothetical protein
MRHSVCIVTVVKFCLFFRDKNIIIMYNTKEVKKL